MSHYIVVTQALKRKRKIRRSIMIVLLALICAVGVVLYFFHKSLTPTLLKFAEVKVQSEATRAINEAIIDVFQDIDYSELITIEKNTDDEIIMLSANSGIVNNLALNTSLKSQDKLDMLFEGETYYIPLGTLSGMPLLNERGPSIGIEITPIGKVVCSIYSKFESVGINQTLHRLFLDVESTVEIIMPTMQKTLKIVIPALLSENLIVGNVPQTYLECGLDWCSSKESS